jgi:hypothetical protein
MMPDIRNQTELNLLLEKIAEEAIEATADEVLEIFRRDYILKYVYESHMPNQVYHNKTRKATFEFRDAWEWTMLKKVANTLMKELWYNPATLGHDITTYLHGSKYSSPEDVRENLMDILNKTGRSSRLWLSSTAVRPVAYWDKFLSDMVDSGKLKTILDKQFSNRGVSRL